MSLLQLNNFSFDDFSFTPYLMIASAFSTPIEKIKNDGFSYFSDNNFSIVCNSNLLSIKKDEKGCIEKVVFFRGYISDLDIDQNSSLDDILEKEDELSRLNLSGIYTIIIYNVSECNISVYTDPLGFSPLYTRDTDGLLLSNIAGCLSFEQDEIDLLALRSFLSNGYIPNNRTLTENINRSKEGYNFKITLPYECELIKNCELPKDSPDLDVNDKSITECSRIFQKTITKLSNKENITLPLSSGWDSRRILAALIKNEKKPSCYSSEVKNSAGIDVDAQHAKELANYHNLKHHTVKRDYLCKNYKDAKSLRILFSAESHDHIWAYSLFNKMPKTGYIFDGLAGDVLGNSGFGKTVLYGSNSKEKIKDHIMESNFDFLFSKKKWPKKTKLRNEISSHISHYTKNDLAPELTFLSFHTRRVTALWGQAMSSPLSVVIAPYLDLKYMSYMLRIKPDQKLTQWMQSKVLEKEAPDTISIKSSRDYNNKSTSPAFTKKEIKEESKYIKHLINSLPLRTLISNKDIIRTKDIILILLYGIAPKSSSRFNWRYIRIIEFLHWWVVDKPYLKIIKSQHE